MSIDQSQSVAGIGLCDQTTSVSITKKLKKAVALAVLRFQVRRERKMLATMPVGLLKDMGISQHQAHIESMRSFNDVPEFRTLNYTA